MTDEKPLEDAGAQEPGATTGTGGESAAGQAAADGTPTPDLEDLAEDTGDDGGTQAPSDETHAGEAAPGGNRRRNRPQPMPFDEAWNYLEEHGEESGDWRDYHDVTPAMLEESERAIETLMHRWLAANMVVFSAGDIRRLVERNHAMYDSLVATGDEPGTLDRMPQHLPYRTVIKGIAAMQGRDWRPIETAVNRKPQNEYRNRIRTEYYARRYRGTVTGIDLECTGSDPLRCHIINVGWTSVSLTRGARPTGRDSVFCGLPAAYEGKPVPLNDVHHITWDEIGGHTGFRADKGLQSRLLALLTARPYMAHYAVFEHTWFLYHLDGYAEAFKRGDTLPIDTREICRKLDLEVDRIPSENHPSSLENWARRRGTLAGDDVEKHNGLDDADLMLRTVIAELESHNLVG